MSLLIKNGEVFTSGKLQHVNVLCDKGKILKITKVNLKADQVIDASGKIILPGLIDCHVHFREPGQTEKEDFLSGSKAAAAGGVTTILAMPNTKPPILTLENLEFERTLARKSIVNYGLYMCGAGNANAIKKAKNIAGVKVYLDVTTGNMKVEDEKELDALFASHQLIAVHAESVKVEQSIKRIKKTKNALYLCHISSKEEMEMIRKQKDKRIFCEVAPHHLFLTDNDAKKLGSFGSMKPPLKSKKDVEALWQAIADGVVDTIGTDHAPHTFEEKKSANPPWGVPGVQTMLPLLLDAVNKKKLTLQKVVELCCQNPAKIFKMKNKGRIEEGYDADLVMIDLDMKKTVLAKEMYSKCGWTPYEGKVLKGWPLLTIVGGSIVFDGSVHEIPAKEVEFGR